MAQVLRYPAINVVPLTSVSRQGKALSGNRAHGSRLVFYHFFCVAQASGDAEGDGKEAAKGAAAQSKGPEWWEKEEKFWTEQQPRGFIVDLKDQNGLSGRWKRQLKEADRASS